MPTNYVAITREMFEEWLDSLRHHGSKGWSRLPNKVGVYLIHLSDDVAVYASSSIGSGDSAMAKDQGAIYLKMVSRHKPALVLNRKAIDQGKFYRTTNWFERLTKAVKNFHDAYLQSKDFYDRSARVTDRVVYQKKWMDKIRAINHADRDPVLQQFLGLLQEGKILSEKQEGLIEKKLAEQEEGVASPNKDLGLLKKLEDLHKALNWDVLKSFHSQVSMGRVLSPAQLRVVEKAEAEVQTPANNLYDRILALHSKVESPFTRSLLEQVKQRGSLSEAQIRVVEKMEAESTKKKPDNIPSKLSETLDALIAQDRWLDAYPKVHGDASSSEYEEGQEEARHLRDILMGLVATIGRETQGQDRDFLRFVWRRLDQGISTAGEKFLFPSELSRLRALGGSGRRATRMLEIPLTV